MPWTSFNPLPVVRQGALGTALGSWLFCSELKYSLVIMCLQYSQTPLKLFFQNMMTKQFPLFLVSDHLQSGKKIPTRTRLATPEQVICLLELLKQQAAACMTEAGQVCFPSFQSREPGRQVILPVGRAFSPMSVFLLDPHMFAWEKAL